MESIRLMLVDDHEIVRTGLKSYLETQTNFEIVAEASSGLEALQKATEFQPHVIVMDITMPDMDGLEATRRLKTIAPMCRVLALTIHNDKEYFFKMLAAGAAGYLTKQAAADELVSAIQTVAAGNVYLQPVLARWLLEDYRRIQSDEFGHEKEASLRTKNDKELESLSSREMQVLELVADGFSNPEIALRLSISPKTVARHRERIMAKLNIHSCTELVKFAIRTGVITV